MGLLDSFTNWAQSPQSQPTADGLLAAGLGILANNHGLTSGTQAIGLGGLQGLQQYQQSKQLAMQQQSHDVSLQQAGFSLAKNKMLLDMARQYLGGAPGAGQSAPQGVPQTQPSPAAAGLDAGGLPAGADGSGPGVVSTPVTMDGGAPGGGAVAAQTATSQPAQAPSGGVATGATPATASPFGNMPGGLVAYGLMTDPTKLFETAAGQYSPTDLQKTMRAAGIDPGSTLGKMILQQSIAKTNYIAPVSGRPGGSLTAADGTTRYELPAPQAGAMWATNQDGTLKYNQAGQPYQIGIGGAADVSRGMAAAQAGGKAQYELQDVWDDGKGRSIKQSVANVADAANGGIPSIPGMGMPSGSQMPSGGGQPPPLPAGMAPLSAPAGRPVMGYPGQIGQPGSVTPPSSSQAFASGPPPGYNAGADVMAKGNADAYQNLKNLASTSGDRLNTLDNMVALANGTTKFGPGSDQRIDRIANINSYLPAGMQLGNDDTVNAQVLQKYMSNLAQQYQKALGGTGTDAQLATVLKGTPTPDMMNKAIVEVVPKLKAQELALQAKTNAADDYLAQHNNNPASLNQFESTWRQNYDPRIYQMQQMTIPQRQNFIKTQPDANALRAKTATALQNGWVQ